MPTLRNLTVRYLRDLARKHLGKGHSGLKTKDELLSALKKFVPGLGDPEDLAAAPRESASSSAPNAASSDTKREKKGKKKEKAEVIRFEKATASPARAPEASEVSVGNATARNGLNGVGGSGGGGAGGNGRSPRGPSPAEPLIEGFFVARVQGEEEARRHHLTEAQVSAPLETRSELLYDEKLQPIPSLYFDDRVVLLFQDPHTVYTYWDLSDERLAKAFEGLHAPRAVLRVFDNGHETRAIDVGLEWGSYYVSGLTAQRKYHVELHAVGSSGESRLIGKSNVVTLPPDDVSHETSVRMMTVPWNVPLPRLREGLRTGRVGVEIPQPPPEPLTFTHYKWVPLPNSGSWQLVSWQERMPAGERPRPEPSGEGHLDLGDFPIGGSSSWTLGSSWTTSPGGSSSWPQQPTSRKS